jgi:hypothetical protein
MASVIFCETLRFLNLRDSARKKRISRRFTLSYSQIYTEIIDRRITCFQPINIENKSHEIQNTLFPCHIESRDIIIRINNNCSVISSNVYCGKF